MAVEIKLLHCRNCDQVFEPSDKRQVYCFPKCQMQSWFRRNAGYWSSYVNEFNKRNRPAKTAYHNCWSKAKRDALRDSGYSKLKKKDGKESIT